MTETTSDNIRPILSISKVSYQPNTTYSLGTLRLSEASAILPTGLACFFKHQKYTNGVILLGLSFWQIAIVVVLVVLLFGRGKLSALMGDMAKGIKSFKAGMAEDDKVAVSPKENMEVDNAEPIQATAVKDGAADDTAKS